MIKKLSYLIVVLLAFGSLASAQPRCGFDAIHAQSLANKPAYAQKVSRFNTSWANYNQTSTPNLPQGLITNTPFGIVYEIPVVIHVIHTGGAVGTTYNPSDAQLIGMIDYLNATYAATWAGYPDSLSGGTRFPVKFILAKRTPNCGATTGINRVNGSGLTGYVANGINLDQTSGANDPVVKALSKWSNHDYYNIWVVNRIDGMDGTSGTFVAGYAYFPGAGSDIDGTVMLATQARSGQKTLPHEIGHAFGLYHTFQGGSTSVCPTNANCNVDGDMICDTEPQRQSNFNCPSDPNPCTGISYNNVQRNIMDYSSCPDRFTPGQRTRFLSGLLTERASLISSLGLLAPATPAVTAASCIPTIVNAGNTLNAGPVEVKFNDMTATSDGGYTADGNLVYIDRSCIQRANVNAGQTYSLSVSTTGGAQRVRVYIDYNNDGIFGTTAPELVYSHDGSSFNELHAANITIPSTGVVTCVPLRMRVVSDRTAANVPTPCGALTTGQAEDFSVNVMGASNTGTISIALTGGTNPSCINTPLTFTATPGGSATSPTFKWYINGIAVTGATATTYTSSTLANGAIITARIFYNGPCGPDSSLSNAITIQRLTSIVPLVNIALTNGSNPGCVGQSLTFTATPTNGGTTPTYQWFTSPDGITWNNTGATTNTFTTSTLPCNTLVRVVMTSALTCAIPTTATSAPIVYTCSATGNTAIATITQTGGTNPTCAGKPVSFTATVTNPGATPTYSWLINGIATGNTTLNFTTTALKTGDTVQFLMISTNPCVTQKVVLSNKIGVTVIPLDTPSVYVAITAGSNPGCADSLLEFTATASSSFGLTGYSWYLNNVNVASGTVYGGISFSTGDRISVAVVAGPGCHVRDTAYSDTITVTRYPTPAAPVISFIGNMLVSNVSGVQWYGPAPSGLIPGATSPSYHPTAPGNYYARVISNGCPSMPSNILQVSMLTIGNYDLSQVQIYPNPTSGMVMFDWGTKPATGMLSVFTPTGQVIKREPVQNATRKTMDLSAFAAGIYFVVIQDNEGHTGTVKITLTK